MSDPLPRPDRVLDVLGYYCPIPVIRTDRMLKSMPAGQVLELLSDDRGVLADIPDWCAGHQHEYLGHRQEGRRYHLFIRKR
ncbi:MAG: sulfurtransferase TusA family protein [Acidobacteriota bacterium]